MKYLSQLSPSEALLVLDYTQVSFKELLKVTFMDLLFKQVVKTVEVRRQPDEHDPAPAYSYVVKGSQFLNYQPLPHENVFLSPFGKDQELQILFRHLIRMGYQNAQSSAAFRLEVIKSPAVASCFSRSLMEKLFGGCSLTPQGENVRKELQTEISQLEAQLPALIQAGSAQAVDIFKVIKGNILLLSNMDTDLVRQVDRQLLEEMNRQAAESGDAGCSACSTWDSLDSFSDSFDSSYGSDGGGDDGGGDDSDGGSGGGSDGDSGCSGSDGGGD